MQNNFKIKRALKEKAPILRSLRIQLVKENPLIFGETYRSEKAHSLQYYVDWIKEYNTKNSAIFIGYIGDTAIGMCAVKKDLDIETGYFGSLGILKAHQGYGYGHLLMEYRLNWVKNNTNFKRIKTIVTKSNVKMLAIAQNNGFKIIGEGFYQEEPEYYLEKDLSSE